MQSIYFFSSFEQRFHTRLGAPTILLHPILRCSTLAGGGGAGSRLAGHPAPVLPWALFNEGERRSVI